MVGICMNLFDRSQIENLKKELELSNDSYNRMKKSMEDMIHGQTLKEKVSLLGVFGGLLALFGVQFQCPLTRHASELFQHQLNQVNIKFVVTSVVKEFHVYVKVLEFLIFSI